MILFHFIFVFVHMNLLTSPPYLYTAYPVPLDPFRNDPIIRCGWPAGRQSVVRSLVRQRQGMTTSRKKKATSGWRHGEGGARRIWSWPGRNQTAPWGRTTDGGCL
ncbi:hypothetical protein MAPG_02277 [Magnaporthiopsis poae ATCC 64411]|uniref:Secreted protein n=1 Tax=Magnaporthiopsis poae (strain ATCC 64411 / 73-15) TaxID=644358 RepID=A0A0C4DQX9_MAGP6|nr:hypothetical protein MAPG_02277 [Magnaporthiopsis poae ATCC 64411]